MRHTIVAKAEDENDDDDADDDDEDEDDVDDEDEDDDDDDDNDDNEDDAKEDIDRQRAYLVRAHKDALNCHPQAHRRPVMVAPTAPVRSSTMHQFTEEEAERVFRLHLPKNQSAKPRQANDEAQRVFQIYLPPHHQTTAARTANEPPAGSGGGGVGGIVMRRDADADRDWHRQMPPAAATPPLHRVKFRVRSPSTDVSARDNNKMSRSIL